MIDSVLVVFAMPEEAQGLFDFLGDRVIFTGLGKVNASYALMKALREFDRKGLPVKTIVNFGTAGSSKHPTHSLVECTRFVQRDMDVTALGFKAGETPFDPEPAVLSVPRRLSLLDGICGSGDAFETGRPKVECDVVDMEAYALAKIAHREGLSFTSVKYITDGADHRAHNDWASNLPKAAHAFLELFETAFNK